VSGIVLADGVGVGVRVGDTVGVTVGVTIILIEGVRVGDTVGVTVILIEGVGLGPVPPVNVVQYPSVSNQALASRVFVNVPVPPCLILTEFVNAKNDESVYCDLKNFGFSVLGIGIAII
jgi:hypothetical protein